MIFRKEGRVGWLLIIVQMIGWCITIATLIRVLEEDSKSLGFTHSSNGSGPCDVTPHEALVHGGVTRSMLLPKISLGRQQ